MGVQTHNPPEEIIGEHPPLETEYFDLAAREAFERGVERIESIAPDSHEAGVRFAEKTVPARELKFILKEHGKAAIEHKDTILFYSAAGLTVAGLFLIARDKLRTRKK